MRDRSLLIRTAAALPVGNAERRRILADIALRSEAIRLAASLPPRSFARNELVRTIAAADKGDKVKALEKSFIENGVEAGDFGDLVSFIALQPYTFEGQPDKVLKDNFKQWWGGSLPLPWRRIEGKVIVKLLRDTYEVIPLALAAVNEPKKGGKSKKTKTDDEPKKGEGSTKKAGFHRTAAAGFIVAIAAAAAISNQQSSAASAAAQQSRQQAKSKGDSSYSPGDSDAGGSVYSHKEQKYVKATGQGYAEKLTDVEYEDYKWAAEKIDMDVVDREAWGRARKGAFSGEDEDLAADKASVREAAVLRSVANLVGKALQKTPQMDKAALRKLVGTEIPKVQQNAEGQLTDHRQYMSKSSNRPSFEERKRLQAVVRETRGNTRVGEDFLKSVWEDHKKAAERNKALNEEHGVKEAPKKEDGKKPESDREKQQQTWKNRSYDQYLEDREGKEQYGPPMSKEDWEARYGR
jgi:hypothetical protein